MNQPNPTSQPEVSSKMLSSFKLTLKDILSLIVLGALSLMGVVILLVQMNKGLGATTGLNDHVSWGLYISTNIFFIGLSLFGTIVSSILFLMKVSWRSPIVRIAELVTIVSLICGGIMIMVDMGHPERSMNLLLHGRLSSPIIWDVLVISTYLFGSCLYLYLSLIPDFALLSNRDISKFRKKVYKFLARGYQHLPEQQEQLGKVVKLLSYALIPLGIMIHTVTAWIASLTLRAGWHSAHMGPYYVAGALFSGAALLIIVLVYFRKRYSLESVITAVHINKIRVLTIVFGFIYVYFVLNSELTHWYTEMQEEHQLAQLISTRYGLIKLTSILGGIVVPLLLLLVPMKKRTSHLTIATLMITLGMFLKRYLIIVPTLEVPFVPFALSGDSTFYKAALPEWGLVVAVCAAFLFLLQLAPILLPIIPIQELEDESNHA